MNTQTTSAVASGDDSLADLLTDLNLNANENDKEIVLDSKTGDAVEENNAPVEQVATGAQAAPDAPKSTNAKKKGTSKGKGKNAQPEGAAAATEPAANAVEAASPAEETKPKKEPVRRKHYSNKAERVSDKLGDKLGEYTVLELDDAALTGAALTAKQQETLTIIKTAGKKVQNRMAFILEFIAGKSGSLNSVIVKTLSILAQDKEITKGVEGNLHKALLAHPYSQSAAKAMGGNTLLALKLLKVIIEQDKKYVANPKSLILMKLQSMGAYTPTA
ncbi:hypothetical protein [Methylobacillus sp.]|uniref:hypothetical protein n=1 Tax=Methylobacillus sp. TaxID=56818 RepID=UPI0012C54F58|nr:hypothetical protein [Methylobacillus sp.]MPS48503.1 hypothetical protein [Methylobacillus sp.]